MTNIEKIKASAAISVIRILIKDVEDISIQDKVLERCDTLDLLVWGPRVKR